ncbi:MAG: hypothetical protein FD133_1416 [Erysipelotrichaceae bacterium]|nr:MAG: hypothetical protein FD179_698 [Erysipelotrichaceae bacterium]TXT17358.1 MAG: hypothetical protein FD133_1416 [Erysipelotrichaceae bacterium]
MKKIEKIIHSDALSVHKNKATKYLIGFYKKSAKESQDILLNIKTELDFFNAAILYESLINKKRFEDTYERERKELTDLWPTLSYQEKNKLINMKLSETKQRCRKFSDKKGTIIWIAFFDQLLNTLYDKEMNIFDLEQYFNLYKNFKKRMIPTQTYGINPYAWAFIDITVIDKNESTVVFYYDPLKTVYRLTEKGSDLNLIKLPLRKDYGYRNEDNVSIISIMDHYANEHKVEMMDELLNSEIISLKVRNSLIKLRKKVK